MNSDEEIRPSYVDQGRKYYNRTLAAKYVSMTDTGFRRKIKKFEEEDGIIIPLASRGGNQKFIDQRILDQFRKPIYNEDEWYGELRQIVELVKSGK